LLPAASTQTCAFGQQRPLGRQVVPDAQQCLVPSGFVQTWPFGQQAPFTHWLPALQQISAPLAVWQIWAVGQQLPLGRQVVSAGQQRLTPFGSVQTRSRGQQAFPTQI